MGVVTIFRPFSENNQQSIGKIIVSCSPKAHSKQHEVANGCCVNALNLRSSLQKSIPL